MSNYHDTKILRKGDQDMADIRNSYGEVVARVEGDRVYDIYGNWLYTLVGDRIIDTYGNWKYTISGEYLLDTYGNRVRDLSKPL